MEHGGASVRFDESTWLIDLADLAEAEADFCKMAWAHRPRANSVDPFLLPHQRSPLHGWAASDPPGPGLEPSRASLRSILNSGFDLDQEDSFGWRPVHWAIWFEQPINLDMLLEAGARTDGSPPALGFALRLLGERDTASECATILLHSGADAHAWSWSEPGTGKLGSLDKALLAQDAGLVRLIYARGLRPSPDTLRALLFHDALWGLEQLLEMEGGPALIRQTSVAHPLFPQLQLMIAKKEEALIRESLPVITTASGRERL